MNARKTLALLGAGYLLLRLGLTAGGYDGVGELAGKLLSDQDLIAASVAVELGGTAHRRRPVRPAGGDCCAGIHAHPRSGGSGGTGTAGGNSGDQHHRWDDPPE